jgi:hypothetical protein
LLALELNCIAPAREHTTDTVLARIQQHIFCARKMELLLHAGADGSTAGLKIDAYHTHHAGS